MSVSPPFRAGLNSAAFVATSQSPGSNVSPALRVTEGRVAGRLFRAEPLRTESGRTIWRVSVGKEGSLGTFETRFSGQLGAAQWAPGSPLYRQVRALLAQCDGMISVSWDKGAPKIVKACEDLDSASYAPPPFVRPTELP